MASSSIVSASLALLVLVFPRPAEACKLPGNGSLELDPKQADDKVAPSIPTVTSAVPRQINVSALQGCVSSCSDRAYLEVELTATDDRTPALELGYRVTISGAQSPPELKMYPDALTSALRDRTSLRFYYDPDAPDFAVELEVRAVDRNGNEGPPVKVRIVDANGGSGCCSTAAGTPPWGAAALAMLVLAVTTRRRRRC